MLLSISCDLEAMNQQVEHSLIQTFPLLKEILRFLGRLFHEKLSVSRTPPTIQTISTVQG